jgi:hypothetical protein
VTDACVERRKETNAKKLTWSQTSSLGDKEMTMIAEEI